MGTFTSALEVVAPWWKTGAVALFVGMIPVTVWIDHRERRRWH